MNKKNLFPKLKPENVRDMKYYVKKLIVVIDKNTIFFKF